MVMLQEWPTAVEGAGGLHQLDPLTSYWECFSSFCQQTILHGWHYLTSEPGPASPPCSACGHSAQSNGGISYQPFPSSGLQPTRGSRQDFNIYRSVFWSIIVFSSVVSGGFFLHDNTSEFLKSTVQTTLDSMVPLSQVLFPSVVVCNINQIRKSLFNELGFYENETLVRIMYEDFIKGTKDNSDNSTYEGSDDDDDEHHTVKRKEFYQVLKCQS